MTEREMLERLCELEQILGGERSSELLSQMIERHASQTDSPALLAQLYQGMQQGMSEMSTEEIYANVVDTVRKCIEHAERVDQGWEPTYQEKKEFIVDSMMVAMAMIESRTRLDRVHKEEGR